MAEDGARRDVRLTSTKALADGNAAITTSLAAKLIAGAGAPAAAGSRATMAARTPRAVGRRRPAARRSWPRVAGGRRGLRQRRPRSWSAVFFLVPLVLVLLDVAAPTGRCSATPTLQLRRTTTPAIADNELLTDAVGFTLKYTVIVTVVLFGGRRSGWRCWCRTPPPRRRASCAPRSSCPARSGSPAASLLFYGLLQRRDRAAQRLPACGSGSSTSRVGLAGSAEHGAVLDGRAGDLALRRLQHADPADRPAGDPDGRLRGGADRRRHPLADVPPHHPAAAAPDDRADADPDASPARCSRSTSSTS